MSTNKNNSNAMPFSRLDLAFAQFLSQRSSLDASQKPFFKALVAQLSYEQSQGHSCMRLNPQELQLVLASGLALEIEPDNALNQSLSALKKLKPQPLIIQDGCLYTHRYWFYESRLAIQLKRLLEKDSGQQNLEAALNRHFPPLENETDWQREAAKTALNEDFAIVTGGPGTGKTTTVVKILALLQEFAGAQPLHIALAAPTGKAAMRLQESIGGNIQRLDCSGEIKQHIPEKVSTLHRLLGAQPPSPYFKHHADNPLPYDVVVIDEASMVDLALMSKLVDALKTGARLILLGDKDQLASVESGSVLADLTCTLKNNTVELLKSHRFGGIIKDLAGAVNEQQGESAWQLLKSGSDIISLLDSDLIDYVAEKQHPYLQLIRQQASFETVFAAFNEFQVLCSNRNGHNGINDINRQVEKKLGLSGHWYSGRPVMITENNAATGLYNGDIGLCIADKTRRGKFMVYFLSPDGSVKKILPSRLPACETVFAMTIHKSQGSEFKEVLIALPDTMNPVLTKELIYTGITRAKETVKIVADRAVFISAVAQKVQRYGGLISKMR